MNKTVQETVEILEALMPLVASVKNGQVAVAPPFTSLMAASAVLRGSSILLASQDVHWEAKGAFTGEISVAMLKELGCRLAIVGHSERRHIFGETDEAVNRKVLALLDGGLLPILCVGETLEQREAEQTMAVVGGQVKAGLKGVGDEDLVRVVVAYEPVWAIGTGRTATPEQAQEVHAAIRAILADIGGPEVAAMVRVIYGGSMTPDNAATLLAQADVDGGLVGGASLEASSFSKIVHGLPA